MKLSTAFNQGFLQGIAHESFFSNKMCNTKWMQHYFTTEAYYSLGWSQFVKVEKFLSLFFLLPLHRMNKEGYIKIRSCGHNMPSQELTDAAHS